MRMQKITVNVWCDGTAEEAGRFYADVFPGGHTEVTSRYPETGLLDFQQPLAGKPLTVDVRIGAYRISLINAGPEFRPNPTVSFLLNFDPLMFDGDPAAAREALDAVWARLSEGGEALMDIGEYPHSPRYGWVQDRFGVSWQLMLTDPAGDARPFVVPMVMFVGEQDGHAARAVEKYVHLLPDSRVATSLLYPDAVEVNDGRDNARGRVMFSDFQLCGQWFAAMDGGRDDHAFGFDCGMSLEVLCADQAEIDRYWNALSAVAEAEQCGWLADEFGLSWQITPERMGELMEHPGAFERMLQMKKIVIAEL